MAGLTNGMGEGRGPWDGAGEVGVPVSERPDFGKEVIWTVDLDTILREGYARGWAGAREAVNKIQKLRPKWRSHIVWKRAEQLGFRQEYVLRRPPWSAAADAALMDFAREQSIETIASWLHRPPMAVRKRFSKLRESAKVQDNYTQLELARDLRVSPKTVRRWEALGLLKRKAGRITHESLESFLRKYGSEINYDVLDKEMQEWLRDCAGFAPPRVQSTNGSATRRHLEKVRECPHCGRKTRGNAHWRHVKSCANKAVTKRADENRQGDAAARVSLIR